MNRIVSALSALALLAAPVTVPPTTKRAQSLTTAPAQYQVTNLGSLGGTSCCQTLVINNRGWVDGTSNLAGDQNHHAFLWISGKMTDLGTLGGPNSNSGGLNDMGDVTVGGADTGIPDPLGEDWCGFGTYQVCRSFVWHNGTRTLIPTLGGDNGDVSGIDSSGQLVLGFAETPIHDPTCIAPQVLGFAAFLWNVRTNTIQELPPLPGDTAGAAFDMNDNGEVAGTSGICANVSFASALHAVLWQNGLPTDLGNLGGNTSNAAFGVNDRGQVVGVSTLADNTTVHAFIWQEGTMTDLGTLPGDSFSFSGNINDKGQVPTQSCDVNFNCRAAIWQNGVMTDLNSLIPSGSPLYLVLASSINSRGQIAGAALDQTGALVPFLATPVASGSTPPGPIGNPKVTLPENVRKILQQRREFGRL